MPRRSVHGAERYVPVPKRCQGREMVSFELTDEQREIRAWVHAFAEKEIRPVAAHYDEIEEFPWPVVKKAAEVGLYGVDFLQQTYADSTGIMPALVSEELTWGCAGIALAIQGTGLPIAAIFTQGTPEQIATWIPACYGTPDKPALGAFAVTEPDAGSDVSSMKTRAVRKNGDWVINGQKVFITNGGIADVHVVVAAVEPELGTRGQASFVVPPGTKGIRQGKKERKMGIRASHTAEVLLEDCTIPLENVLGGIENQAIAFMLADMATEIEATRALIWRALWEGRSGGEFKKAEGSMAKLKAGEVAVKVTEQAIQICGGYGYIRDFPVEKWHRDAKIYTLFEGTSEIQRIVISRALAKN